VLDKLVHEAQRRTTAKPGLQFAVRRVAEYQATQPVAAVMSRPRD
jgi:hypothetical protein